MTYAQRTYINTVNLMTDGQEPITHCCECGLELYYGDEIGEFDNEIYCEDCFNDFVNQFKRKLEDKDIPEPDWDSLPGGHDEL